MNWAVGSFVCISILGWYVVYSSPGRVTCRRSHAAEQARMHDIIVQHEKRLESRSDHVQISEPGMSRLHS
mgnify:FL=1